MWEPCLITEYYARQGCLRWRKARSHLCFLECACETAALGRRQPGHICFVRYLINFFCISVQNIFVQAVMRTLNLRNRYVAQKFLYKTTELFGCLVFNESAWLFSDVIRPCRRKLQKYIRKFCNTNKDFNHLPTESQNFSTNQLYTILISDL